MVLSVCKTMCPDWKITMTCFSSSFCGNWACRITYCWIPFSKEYALPGTYRHTIHWQLRTIMLKNSVHPQRNRANNHSQFKSTVKHILSEMHWHLDIYTTFSQTTFHLRFLPHLYLNQILVVLGRCQRNWCTCHFTLIFRASHWDFNIQTVSRIVLRLHKHFLWGPDSQQVRGRENVAEQYRFI